MLGFVAFYRTWWALFRERRDNPLVRYHLAHRGGMGGMLRIWAFGLPALMLALFLLAHGFDRDWHRSPSFLACYILLVIHVPATFWMYRGTMLRADRIDQLILTRMTPMEIAFGSVWPVIKLQWFSGVLFFLLPGVALVLAHPGHWHPMDDLNAAIAWAMTVSTVVLAGQMYCLRIQFGEGIASAFRGPWGILSFGLVAILLSAALHLLWDYYLDGLRFRPDPITGITPHLLLQGAVACLGVFLLGWMRNLDLPVQVLRTSPTLELPPADPLAFRFSQRRARREGWLGQHHGGDLHPKPRGRSRILEYSLLLGVVGGGALFFLSLSRHFYVHHWTDLDKLLDSWNIRAFFHGFFLGFLVGGLLAPRWHRDAESRGVSSFRDFLVTERRYIMVVSLMGVVGLVWFFHFFYAHFEDPWYRVPGIGFRLLVMASVYAALAYSVWCSIQWAARKWRIVEFCVGLPLYVALFHLAPWGWPEGAGISSLLVEAAGQSLFLLWILGRLYAAWIGGRILYLQRVLGESLS